MKRITALTVAVTLLALLALTSQASAQDGPSLTADPASVPAEGEHTFTISGAGFTAGLSLFVLPCTAPGEPMTPENAAQAIAAIAQTDCNLGSLTPAVVGADGTFSVTATATVGQNFVWVAGDAAQTESAAAPVFIVEPMDDMGDDMGDDMAPEGAAETGFGGAAGSDGNSLAVPLAATIAAVTLLGGAALATRRNA